MKTLNTLNVSVNCSSKRVTLVVVALACVNVCVILGSAAFAIYYRSYLSGNWQAGSVLKFFLVQFHLARENVFASWYSSMLLLLVSVISALCFVADRKLHPSHSARYLSYGWLLFTFIFAWLSLDELGSLHERIGMLAVLNPYGDYGIGWVRALALPIGIVALFMLAFGWVHIRHSPWALAFIILGVVLFLCNPLLELAQMSMLDAQSGKVTLALEYSMLLEEGAEMFGSLSFLTAAAIYASFAAKQSGNVDSEALPSINFTIKRKTALFCICLFIALFGLTMVIVQFAVGRIAGGDEGIPKNWFVSTLAGLAALIFLQIWDSLESAKRFHRLLYLTSALYCFLFSVYYGANAKGWLSSAELSNYPMRSFIDNGLLLAAVILGVALALQVREWWSNIATVAWCLLLICAFATGEPYTIGPFDFLAFAMLIPALLAHLCRWQPSVV